jgi:heptose I phosphotransferase
VIVHIQHDPEWAAMVGEQWHHHLMEAKLFDRLHSKQGRSIARWTITGGGRELAVFVKRHYQHSRWQSWLARLGLKGHLSDAGREWHHLLQVRSLGLAVPRPLAMAEWIGPGSRMRSALVVEELAGMLALHEAVPLAARVLPPDRFREWKRGLIAELARMVRLLHQSGYFHRDLYLCHFFIHSDDIGCRPEDWRGRVTLIDFHRLTRQFLFRFPLQVKDLAQLLYSARIDGIGFRDILSFWRSYGGSRLLGWVVRLKAGRYQRHNRLRDRLNESRDVL